MSRALSRFGLSWGRGGFFLLGVVARNYLGYGLGLGGKSGVRVMFWDVLFWVSLLPALTFFSFLFVFYHASGSSHSFFCILLFPITRFLLLRLSQGPSLLLSLSISSYFNPSVSSQILFSLSVLYNTSFVRSDGHFLGAGLSSLFLFSLVSKPFMAFSSPPRFFLPPPGAVSTLHSLTDILTILTFLFFSPSKHWGAKNLLPLRGHGGPREVS